MPQIRWAIVFLMASFTIKDLMVNPMHISHDAADPVGYRFSYGIVYN